VPTVAPRARQAMHEAHLRLRQLGYRHVGSRRRGWPVSALALAEATGSTGLLSESERERHAVSVHGLEEGRLWTA
jgi:hypothetical protein